MAGERFWKALALILSVAAVLASLNTVLSAPRQQDILARKMEDLQKIKGYAGRWAREDAFRNRLDARQAWKPVDLDQVRSRILKPGTAEITPRPAVPATKGWLCREAAIRFRDVSYADAIRFLAAAAESSPAWRLREIEIIPASTAGEGVMSMVLEALEKKQP